MIIFDKLFFEIRFMAYRHVLRLERFRLTFIKFFYTI